MKPVWAHLTTVLSNPAARARLLLYLWLVSLAVLVIGFGVIVLRALGR